jgi:hypothetical protein
MVDILQNDLRKLVKEESLFTYIIKVIEIGLLSYIGANKVLAAYILVLGANYLVKEFLIKES